MILVIGGRSKIGSALIEVLAAGDEPVRALVRSSERADSFPRSIEPVVGDLADLRSLRHAMDGAGKVFLLCGPTETEVEFNRNAIDAAQAGGVQLLVRSSILGADPDSQATFARDHGRSDAYLAESAVPHVIVRPNLFQQNVTETTIPSIGADGNFYMNAGDARISMVDTRDVAAVAAVALTRPGHEDKTYDVTGPEALSYQDIAAKLSAAAGRTITYVAVSDDAERETLLGFAMGKWLVGALVDLYQDYRRSRADGYAAHTTDTVIRLTGRPPRALDQLIDESRAALNRA